MKSTGVLCWIVESRMRKRRRVGEAIDIEKRLESLILAVGEKVGVCVK